jgi:preprotein translocase subunit SecG
MNAVFVILTVLVVIAAILLTIVVLLQNGKGDGLASNFVAANQTFGVRQTADMLEKITWGLVTFILVLSIVTSFTLGNKATDSDVKEKIENSAAAQQPEFPGVVPSQEAPATEAE